MTITTRNTTKTGYVSNNAATLSQIQADQNFIDSSIARDKGQNCRLILGTSESVLTLGTYTQVSLIPFNGNTMFFGDGTDTFRYTNISFSTTTVTVVGATKIEGGVLNAAPSVDVLWYADGSSGTIVLKPSVTIAPVRSTTTGYLQGTGLAANMIFVGYTRTGTGGNLERTAGSEPALSHYNQRARTRQSTGLISGTASIFSLSGIECYGSLDKTYSVDIYGDITNSGIVNSYNTLITAFNLDSFGGAVLSSTPKTSLTSGANTAKIGGSLSTTPGIEGSSIVSQFGYLDAQLDVTTMGSLTGTYETTFTVWY